MISWTRTLNCPFTKRFSTLIHESDWPDTEEVSLCLVRCCGTHYHWLSVMYHRHWLSSAHDWRLLFSRAYPADWRRQPGRPGRLEKTTRSSPHDVAHHPPTGSETTPPYAPRSSRCGSEPPSVEDDVDVWRYAIVSCMPETTTIQDIIVAPLWQFVCTNSNLLTYLLDMVQIGVMGVSLRSTLKTFTAAWMTTWRASRKNSTIDNRRLNSSSRASFSTTYSTARQRLSQMYDFFF